MISINATLILQVIQFLILVFILNRLFLRPIIKVLSEREQYIEKTRNEITELESEIERVKNTCISREISARNSALMERSRLRHMGVSEAEKILDDSRKELAAMRTEANQKAKNEIEKAQPFLHEQAAFLADLIMEKVIGRRIEA